MRSGLVLAVALALSACAQPATLPASPVPAGPGITIAATAVALNPQDLAQDRIGAFRYAGGLVLSSSDTARFHGLSDLAVGAGGTLTTVSDEGDLIKARLVLDKTGRLVGLTDGRIAALTNPDGKPLQGKQAGDSEGLALLAGGDLLVSFEQRHRIWLYPVAGGPPRPAPMPQAAFPDNGGLEALGPDPASGADAYVAGAEESGQTWACRVSTSCAPGPVIAKPPEFGLVAVARLPQGRTAWLLRAWDAARGSRISLVVRDDRAEVARLDLARPLTVDNFEALAAVPAKDGTIRFYLLSDDNFQNAQRTLLLAFDWKP
ncbi:MAG: esterase-like activity of phytase family protein [Phenylobacterium sp.]|uniref:esterase-like activity of phytase family protein n=1 Tax=Phenylobacterium sp. TaxID=1871053 RepID=UPI00273505C7|nr:esterase-like activity of phytase family protein [Phenylobacterium sp.]MDP3748860.1 esterase-like activity of phytase family protein [Phenylobacterium sp.]